MNPFKWFFGLLKDRRRLNWLESRQVGVTPTWDVPGKGTRWRPIDWHDNYPFVRSRKRLRDVIDDIMETEVK